jgi:hypothetical protein
MSGWENWRFEGSTIPQGDEQCGDNLDLAILDQTAGEILDDWESFGWSRAEGFNVLSFLRHQ